MSHPGVTVMVRGRLYPSLRAAARAHGVAVQTVWNALERGAPDSVGVGRARPCVLDGVAYPSRAAAAEALGITPAAISKRLRKAA